MVSRVDAELVKTLLGSSALATVFVTLITLGAKLYQNRKVGNRAEDMDDATWNTAFKAGAERHVLGYDVPVHHAVLDLQHEVNKLRQQNGDEAKQFIELPDPRDYPLFPNRGGSDSQHP